jgi:predicted DsbA family dithiol-disulfide isomerase
VRFVIKFFPYKYRHFSFIAAEAALAAWSQGKFWQMHWKLLEEPRLDRDSLIRYAGELGLDVKKFTSDLDSMADKDIIERDLALARKLDLYNTPAFFFNGRKVLGDRPYDNLEKIFLEELHAAEKKDR